MYSHCKILYNHIIGNRKNLQFSIKLGYRQRNRIITASLADDI